MADIAARLERQGFCLVEGLISDAQTRALRDWSDGAELTGLKRSGETYGARNLLGFSLIRETVSLPSVVSCLTSVLGKDFRVVRGLFFNKTPEANWPVAWHQDLSLAVREHHDLTGWGNWSVKGGVPHVQPPTTFLDRMVTVRLHLDDCPSDNGALRVLSGSHCHGLLSRDAINVLAKKPVTVAARSGDGLLMRPLLVHSSSPAKTPSHRRVLHLEFAPEGVLPAPLQWAAA